MRLFDPTGGRPSKLSVFVASLPYSGMLFACACVNERQQAWLGAHMQAFEYFGGVAEVIVPDNASTASNAISVADRNRRVLGNPHGEDGYLDGEVIDFDAVEVLNVDAGFIEQGVVGT